MIDAKDIETWWVLFAGAGTTIGGWYTAAKRERKKTEQEYRDKIEALYGKISALEDKDRSRSVELGQIKAVIAAFAGKEVEDISFETIKNMVRSSGITERELFAYIKSMPCSAFIKRRLGERDYQVEMISQVYADRHYNGDINGHRKAKKRVWSEQAYKQFIDNDERAYLNAGKRITVRERVVNEKENVRGVFVGYKWSFTFNNKSYVAGIGHHESD